MNALAFDYRNSFPHNLREGDPALLERVHSVYATYPFCRFPARTASHGWKFRIPVTFVFGSEDEFVSVDDCVTASERLRADGIPAHLPPPIEGATHAFDERDNLGDSPFVRYDPDQTKEAHDRFHAYLQTVR